MSGRSTRDRLTAARRAAMLARLTSAGELAEPAEAKIAAWEARTAGDGRPCDGAYRDAGWDWMHSGEPLSRVTGES
jgi:hypothetical protein